MTRLQTVELKMSTTSPTSQSIFPQEERPAPTGQKLGFEATGVKIRRKQILLLLERHYSFRRRRDATIITAPGTMTEPTPKNEWVRWIKSNDSNESNESSKAPPPKHNRHPPADDGRWTVQSDQATLSTALLSPLSDSLKRWLATMTSPVVPDMPVFKKYHDMCGDSFEAVEQCFQSQVRLLFVLYRLLVERYLVLTFVHVTGRWSKG